MTKIVDRVKTLVRALLMRIALLGAGCVGLIAAIWLNLNAGNEILAGLLWPESPDAIVISVARLMAPVPGLWLIYRALAPTSRRSRRAGGAEARSGLRPR